MFVAGRVMPQRAKTHEQDTSVFVERKCIAVSIILRFNSGSITIVAWWVWVGGGVYVSAGPLRLRRPTTQFIKRRREGEEKGDIQKIN